ncbi:chorismate-binding protein [bacterium endosymbiont of Pedicinus badii]|uniref:chorismate-binding protein n=1 Tax=bacterium endosymbiont of Pedicinus badii TaxID=1719126 RepID=UPI0009BA3379|nr:chorismate-binding protein [bacterium endosymbiont of Pedicinus badii]OQM34418.1 hypothetical protein AOQ89_00825 [bacterium endosymbiont of Pedicinus badii]
MYYESLSYQENKILEIFSHFSDIPWSILLHSGNNNKKDGKYDIFSSFPEVTLLTKNFYTFVTYKNKSFVSTKDPIELVEYFFSKFNRVKRKKNIPFQGGAMGFLGYDLSKYFFSGIPNISKKDLYLPDMAVGIYNWAIISEFKKKKITLVSRKNPNKIIKMIKSLKNNKKENFSLSSSWKSNMSKLEYKKKFEKIFSHLNKGNCYQICFGQRFFSSYSGNEWRAFCNLLFYNSASFSSFIRINNSQTILSFSPERFLQVKKKCVISEPIKGTTNRSSNKKIDKKKKIDLFLSEKNKSENVMIVDLLRNDIGKIAIPGSVYVSSLFRIEKLKKVYQMVSTINGKISSNKKIFKLIRSCFPGGSITGAPKIKAMQILESIEPNKRNAWCGNVFYLSFCKNFDSNILIRTLITEEKKIYCSAGGGITISSKYEEEFEETIHKIMSIIPVLNAKYGILI